MDGAKFDTIARAVAMSRTRRSLLKAIGAVLGAVPSIAAFNATSAATSRGPGTICRKAADCDSLLCGPADRTGRRYCVCPAGYQNCNGVCLDPTIAYQSDPKNCGACGHRCLTGEVCCHGACLPAEAVCGGLCCAANQVCAGGACCTPEDPSVTCGSSCGNATNNCGQTVDCGPCCAALDALCESSQECCSGRCANATCRPPLAANGQPCGADGDCLSGACCSLVCVDPATFAADAANCGACDNACPGEISECATPVCIDGGCSTHYAESGTPLTAQTAGDCQLAVCDGEGGTTTIADDTDLPTSSSSACMEPVCTGGVLSSAPVSAGSPCAEDGGTVCDGAGQCVPCLVDTDCDGGICLPDNSCCTPDAFDATCAGQCGPVIDNCGQEIDCGACCQSDPDETTCAGQCGTVLNNCDQEVDCGTCCDAGYEIGSDGETCVPTEETCNGTLGGGSYINGADFRECDFASYDLSNIYLVNCDFSGANLAGVSFIRTNVSGSIFDGADLTGVNWALAVCPDVYTIPNFSAETCCSHLNGAVPAACS